jgi:hypothetical protein
LYGTVLSFGGGLGTTGDGALAALGTALLYQFIVSLVQFVTCANWRNPLYLIALAASVVPSFIGYRSYTAVPIAQWILAIDYDLFTSRATAMAVWSADRDTAGLILLIHLVAIIGFVLIDIVPERVFVQHT